MKEVKHLFSLFFYRVRNIGLLTFLINEFDFLCITIVEFFDKQIFLMIKLLILNLMPNKKETENHLESLLFSSANTIEITYLFAKTHQSKNKELEYVLANYSFLDDIKDQYFDGMIVTGAPVELLEFEEVDYWQELCEILTWAESHVKSSFYICWAAQAALYHYYNITKYKLSEKMFGVFEHINQKPDFLLMQNIPAKFNVPHSRHTEIRKDDILPIEDLIILADSVEAGIHLISNSNGSLIFATGHAEYPTDRLQIEYQRDLIKKLNIQIPKHYFPDDNVKILPINTWNQNAKQLFKNWIDFYIS